MPQRLIVLLLPLLLLGCDQSSPPWHGRNISGFMPDLAFELSNANGQHTSAADSAGKLRLLYFGFSHCEHICSSALTILNQAITQLGPDAGRAQILFVSVDPARDTPEVLQRYTSHFGPQIVGLTGSKQQLDNLSKRYRVGYSYGAPDAQGNYEVYHSSGVFVFDEEGRIQLLLNADLGAAAIATDLRRLLSANNR